MRRYPLPLAGTATLRLPVDAAPLRVAALHSRAYLWALVMEDDDIPTGLYDFEVVIDDEVICARHPEYVGSFEAAGATRHVFRS